MLKSFDFEPRYLIIQAGYENSKGYYQVHFALIPVEQLKVLGSTTFYSFYVAYDSQNAMYARVVEASDNKTFSWYGFNYIYQINEKGYTYSYLAIG